MIWITDNQIMLEEFEPYTDICWECGDIIKEAKYSNILRICKYCGREWIFGKFLEEFDSVEEFIKWLKEKGIEKGKSTLYY